MLDKSAAGQPLWPCTQSNGTPSERPFDEWEPVRFLQQNTRQTSDPVPMSPCAPAEKEITIASDFPSEEKKNKL